MKYPQISIIFIWLVFMFSCTNTKSVIAKNEIHNNSHDYVIKDGILIGKIPLSAISDNENFKWFRKNYDRYNTKTDLAQQLATHLEKNIQIDIYLGTWCGDTRRMLPKIVKILESVNYPIEQVNFFALDRNKNRLPFMNEELDISYVPTIIFYKDGKEKNRIVERHVESLESDMLKIFKSDNYKSYSPE